MKHSFLICLSFFLISNLNCVEKKDKNTSNSQDAYPFSPTKRLEEFKKLVDIYINELFEQTYVTNANRDEAIEDIIRAYQCWPAYKSLTPENKINVEKHLRNKINNFG